MTNVKEKKNLSLKIFASMMIMLISISFSQATLVQAKSENRNNIEKRLKNKIASSKSLKSIESSNKVPSNIEPLNFNTIEEAELFLDDLNKAGNGNGELKEDPNFITPFSIGDATAKKYIMGTLYVSLNVYVQYEYLWSPTLKKNYFSKIMQVHTYITGFSAWYDYTHQYHTTTFSANKTAAKIKTVGTMSSYFTIAGIPTPYKVTSTQEATIDIANP